MDLKYQFAAGWLFLMLATVANVQGDVFDVVKLGASANGKSDISQIFTKAFSSACNATTPSKVLVPKGTYFMNPVQLTGPCKAPIVIQIQGTLMAPPDPASFGGKDAWIVFGTIENFTLFGGGVLDGQGAKAWTANNCHISLLKCSRTMNLRLDFITNGLVTDITSKDSKNFHINVLGAKNLTFDHIIITAPLQSINTDGIHVGRSEDVTITDTRIGTGDDCISVGDGTKQLKVSKVTCGPGHGISVGSLGWYPKEEPVDGIFVTDCTLKDTTNGIRIKTWPSSPKKGVATNMHFENIVMMNVSNPILIDQEYCPYGQCKLAAPSSIKLSDISFKNIRGTSFTPEIVKLACSRSYPCDQVKIGDIDIIYKGPAADGPAKFTCSNINPSLFGKLNPPACTSKAETKI